jgi:hypothetical protein
VDSWYLTQDGHPVGPLRFEELIRELDLSPQWRERHVWTERYDSWQTAGAVPEIRARLVTPPPLPTPITPKTAPVASPAKKRSLGGFIAGAVGLILTLIAAAIGGTIGRDGVRALFNRGSNQSIEEVIAQTFPEIRKRIGPLPKKIDDMTTLVDLTISGATTTYHYILNTNNYLLDPGYKSSLQKTVMGNVCASTMTSTMKHGAIYEYRYVDPSGKPIINFAVRAGDCK